MSFLLVREFGLQKEEAHEVGDALDAFHVSLQGGLVDVWPGSAGILDLRRRERDGEVGAICSIKLTQVRGRQVTIGIM